MKISSHTGFQPLKEVWLGDSYPADYFNNFANQEQDLLCHISEQTQTDLKNIEKKLNELGVTVRRPEFDNREKYLDDYGNLCKPPITPRDFAFTIADTLYVIPQYLNGFCGFEKTLDQYRSAKQNIKILDREIPDPLCFIMPPSLVRVGRDIFVDDLKDSVTYNTFLDGIKPFAKDYRIHVTHTGDHTDGVFCPVKPGCIFSTHYRQEYKSTFPGWDINFLPDTTQQRGHDGTWWVEGSHFSHFNKTILEAAKFWVGDSRETIFEVNMLIVDEKNILCISEDDWALRKLEEYGFTPHVCTFSDRGFWDGGLHCLTTDIHRVGECIDYWPNRGDNGMYYYD
jgi:hypothetical protein